MARVNVDSIAFSDARFAVLAALMGSDDPDLALGRMLRLWNQCYERETYVLTQSVIVWLFRGNPNAPQWLVESELAVPIDGDPARFRICGTKGRIEYVARKRATAIANGSKGGRPPKTNVGTKKNQRGIQTETTPDTPPDTPLSLSSREKRTPAKEEKSQSDRTEFTPPTLAEVRAYCAERGSAVDPAKWFDHYTANGWMVGKVAMVDWQASLRRWETNGIGNNGKPEPKSDDELKARYGSKSKGGE